MTGMNSTHEEWREAAVEELWQDHMARDGSRPWPRWLNIKITRRVLLEWRADPTKYADMRSYANE